MSKFNAMRPVRRHFTLLLLALLLLGCGGAYRGAPEDYLRNRILKPVGISYWSFDGYFQHRSAHGETLVASFRATQRDIEKLVERLGLRKYSLTYDKYAGTELMTVVNRLKCAADGTLGSADVFLGSDQGYARDGSNVKLMWVRPDLVVLYYSTVF